MSALSAAIIHASASKKIQLPIKANFSPMKFFKTWERKKDKIEERLIFEGSEEQTTEY